MYDLDFGHGQLYLTVARELGIRLSYCLQILPDLNNHWLATLTSHLRQMAPLSKACAM